MTPKSCHAGLQVELSNLSRDAAALGRVPESAGNVVGDVVQQVRKEGHSVLAHH